MVVLVSGNLIDEAVEGAQPRLNYTLLGKCLQGAIDRGLRKAAGAPAGLPVNLRRGKMRPRVHEDVEDRHALRSNAKAEGSQLRSQGS